MEGNIDFVGCEGRSFSPAEGAAILDQRSSHPGLAPHPHLPDDTRIWAALQQASGGTWGGCVYDTESILGALTKS
jgi:hypothetical protein